MSVKKYKFVSPGVFVSEIDNSQITEAPADPGPVLIGRAQRGPGLRPVQVDSFSEFINIFGNPTAVGTQTDAWRAGDSSAPLYAVYAAQAWLRNNSPITFVRLLGDEHPKKTSGGEAGWYTRDTDGTFNGMAQDGGGAYGLFIFPSGNVAHIAAVHADSRNNYTGSLAAIFYCNSGYIGLSGSIAGFDPTSTDVAHNTSSAGALIASLSGEKAFTAEIFNSSQEVVDKLTFSLDKNSDKYIRNVFNTSPSKSWTRVTDNSVTYFLGETFERHSAEAFKSNGVKQASSVGAYGAIVPLKLQNSATSIEQGDHRKASQAAQTGWFFSQDLNTINGSTLAAPVANNYSPQKQQKLFKIHALDTGAWDTKNLKVSISSVRASSNDSNPYGTFTVELRRIDDLDSAVQIIEQFNNCNLNPDSPDYVAKKIGDRYQTWDTTNNRYTEYGDYANQSRFIRVEINPDVNNKTTDERLLPFGVYGPPRHQTIQFTSGSHLTAINSFTQETVASAPRMAYPASGASYPGGRNALNRDTGFLYFPLTCTNGSSTLSYAFTASLEFPRTYLRISSSDGRVQSPKSAYFGVDTSLGADGFSTYNFGTQDVLQPKAKDIDDFSVSNNGATAYSWIFSLDDISRQGGTGTGGDITPDALYVSGSRAAGNSITAISSSYTSVLDEGFNSFTTVLHGGNDGLDIYEKEPFNNTDALSGDATETSSYAYYSVKKAVDSISDAEVVEYNLAAMPGITNTALNDYLISVCEDRGDSLAVIDIPSAYVPAVDGGSANSYAARRYTAKNAIDALKTRGLNSSYACTYFPWVQMRDTVNDRILWAPPSIAALGTFSSSESATRLWFAPAGFNRGGLTEGSAGIPIIGVRDKLTSKQRDDLYEANINPIASFPAEGIVIFGQKTLQVTRSALDRINVRRLMIFVKKQISRISNGLLFDQNVPATWDRFLAQVDPFLEGIKTDFGLTDFKVVLDETTTTPDLIDRNIMYAKIFLKPARAIEYIAIDFNITNTGASFED
tara:strand:+ start:7066 stop:10104 length:3039 start_codon:yes stop_codon:yes gene_type:complete